MNAILVDFRGFDTFGEITVLAVAGVGVYALLKQRPRKREQIMTSLILSTAARYLLPLLLLFSFFILIRGHNEPGGGFIGGLVAAAAFALNAIAFDVGSTRRTLRIDPRTLIPAGLLDRAGEWDHPAFFWRTAS